MDSAPSRQICLDSGKRGSPACTHSPRRMAGLLLKARDCATNGSFVKKTPRYTRAEPCVETGSCPAYSRVAKSLRLTRGENPVEQAVTATKNVA
jgi:hypothetical protein